METTNREKQLGIGMAQKIAAVVFSLGCVQASSVWGLGLGDMTLESYLNEPLAAQVDLLNLEGLGEDQIRIRLATSEDFERMGVDRAYFLTSISFDVEVDEQGRGRILITSEEPVLEPYLDFIVEARWPSGRLLREYTVLVDPPVFDDSTPVVSASERVAEIDGEAEPAKKKPVASASSGTRVDIRDSNLAPGQMPSRAFNAGASPTPIAGQQYMISRDDTLWDIASRARPAGASVYQTMLDIQRMNPDAFIGGNINQVKAGYIVYLPDENDISSADLDRALAEVQSQNEAYERSKALAPDEGIGPSLRISAEPEDSSVAGATAGSVAATAAAMEEAERAGLERDELEQRLSSMEQQVETLQRIVTLKDEQIAALQNAITETEADGIGELSAMDSVELEALEGELPESEIVELDVGAVPGAEGDDMMLDEGVEPVVEVIPEPEPVVEEIAEVDVEEPVAATPAPAPAAQEEDTPGFFSNIWFIVGAVVLAVLGFIFMRRRSATEADDLMVEPATDQDAFADVQLRDQALDVEQDSIFESEPAAAAVAEEVPQEEPESGSRGYGERKHDEYASDEASDALAEAEIYIAYGRYPQAIDLLKTALVNDPDNPDYRLKLLQLYMETGNRSAAREEMSELEAIGDAESISAGRAALDGQMLAQTGSSEQASAIDANTDLLSDSGDALESEFTGLEIEEPETTQSVDDELDLSADFEKSELSSESEDEELVIAAGSDGLSTKLDLARAYIDMGDEDGARQILEEVAAEGGDELKDEARALLERIG
ncbi:MAG: FimV/HubP family polar landmark protein [Pseudomonadota bacterium]